MISGPTLLNECNSVLRIPGGAPTEEEEREHAITRSEELRQYYERIFRLPAVTQVRLAVFKASM